MPFTMDVDSPVALKRSSSAPMINELNTTMTTASTTSSTRDSSPFNNFPSSQPRTRRFSASFSPGHSASASGPRLTPRVNQLRLEECIDIAGREAAHERETRFALQMSQSCEDLALIPGSPTQRKSDNSENRRSGPGPYDQLHLNLAACPPACTSPSPTPSPTRLNRQCFSPGVQTWKSTPSPSPTRTFPRRSQSPIPIRPSTLGPVKRKCELEEDQYASPPAKRANCFIVERGGLLMAHSNRLDTTSSPLPGSLSSVGTPESLSSADSPGFTFRPVDSPSPGRSMIAVTDEPMHEEQLPDLTKQDQVMASVEQSPS